MADEATEKLLEKINTHYTELIAKDTSDVESQNVFLDEVSSSMGELIVNQSGLTNMIEYFGKDPALTKLVALEATSKSCFHSLISKRPIQMTNDVEMSCQATMQEAPKEGEKKSDIECSTESDKISNVWVTAPEYIGDNDRSSHLVSESTSITQRILSQLAHHETDPLSILPASVPFIRESLTHSKITFVELIRMIPEDTTDAAKKSPSNEKSDFNKETVMLKVPFHTGGLLVTVERAIAGAASSSEKSLCLCYTSLDKPYAISNIADRKTAIVNAYKTLSRIDSFPGQECYPVYIQPKYVPVKKSSSSERRSRKSSRKKSKNTDLVSEFAILTLAPRTKDVADARSWANKAIVQTLNSSAAESSASASAAAATATAGDASSEAKAEEKADESSAPSLTCSVGLYMSHMTCNGAAKVMSKFGSTGTHTIADESTGSMYESARMACVVAQNRGYGCVAVFGDLTTVAEKAMKKKGAKKSGRVNWDLEDRKQTYQFIIHYGRSYPQTAQHAIEQYIQRCQSGSYEDAGQDDDNETVTSEIGDPSLSLESSSGAPPSPSPPGDGESSVPAADPDSGAVPVTAAALARLAGPDSASSSRTPAISASAAAKFLNWKNNDDGGNTPVMLAIEMNYKSIAEYLVQFAGLDGDVTRDDGSTALLLALKCGMPSSVIERLSRVTSTKSCGTRNRFGQSAESVAYSMGVILY